MNTQALIGSMQDTLSFSYGPVLRNRTQKAAASSRVYQEGFVSPKINIGEGELLLQEIGTLEAARLSMDLGKVAVLNFANGEEPCGGARQGTNTQEEYLCRNTNLYHCLTRPQLLEPFYGYHRARGQSSDRVIYTQGITVFKDGAPVPEYLPHRKWYEIDVLTCAAPSMEETPHLGDGAREILFRSRIRNICEAARDNDVQVLILGAFGCGAFGNPPLVVAQAFHKVLVEEGCRRYFRRVIFAILKTEETDPNDAAFSQVFFGAEEETCQEESALTRWQRGNPWYKKQISILGDSISTLEGFQPQGYPVYYEGEIQEKTGIRKREDTWWGQVISHFGADLLINNSYAGRTVVPGAGLEEEPQGGRFRWDLHMEELMPQGIMIYLGINDWMQGVPVSQFRRAYGDLLEQLRCRYPEAVLWCCTLCETRMSAAPQFVFPKAFGGIALSEYNEAICQAAGEKGALCLDLHSQNTPYDSLDGLHPNLQGMRTLALGILRATVDPAGLVLLPLKQVELPEKEGSREKTARASLSQMEKAMESFFASGYRDSVSFQTVLFYCPRVPLYFPEGEEGLLKIHTRMGEMIPAFTSEKETEKAPKGQLLRRWPEEYLPLIEKENCPVIIDPFRDSRFVLSQKVLREVLAPAISTDPNCVLVPEPGTTLLGEMLECRFLCEKRLSVEGRNAVMEVRDQEKGIRMELWCIDTVTPGLEAVWETSLRRIAQRMELRHPNIQQYPTMFRAGQYLCILRQSEEGMLMQDAMKVRVPPLQALSWGRELASALSYLEKKGLLLSNLSPRRILIHHNHIRLCDLSGLVSRNGVIPAPRGTARGYAPREGMQESGSHVYTVGMLLYHLLTGIDPNEPGFTYLPLSATKLDRRFAQTVDRCLLVEPEGRYRDCEALLQALEEIAL